MPKLDLILTLFDDLVASERPATEGGHESLDYLPGAMFLGAVAARLYGGLTRGDAFRLFHSGAVRFGDAVPLVQGHPCWPIPLCWHEQKGHGAQGVDGWLDSGRMVNLQHGDLPDGQQPKQLREGFVRADGYCHRVGKALRMKTAIDPKTGRVAESQLFGYEAIRAKQVYSARIEAEDDATLAPLWKLIEDVFARPTELLLGRSRSAEYGRVRVERAAKAMVPPDSTAPGKSLTLWCLSDLALLDAWGQPTLTPEPLHFGLDRGRLDPARSFLRFRRFAPWNAYRRAHDLQRQVIRRGSVIAFVGMDPPLTDAERRHLAAGVGLHREQGLGCVCVDPALLATSRPAFGEVIEPESAPARVERPSHPLVRWLEAQGRRGGDRGQAEAVAKDLAGELKRRYSLARTYAGVPQHLSVGPSPAQWGSVYEAARNANDIAALRRTLFEGDNAVCKPRGENWQDQFRDDQGVRRFRDWLQGVVQGGDITVEALRRFGREAQRIAQREHGGGDRRGSGT